MHNQENRITKQPHVKILWTGGFDSSCRMVQLSKYPVTVQPYYLRDNRVSEQKELEAIAAITSDIENHPETKCIILPLIQFNVADIKPDPEITEGYRRIRDLTGLGSQYDWLARFAKRYPGLELCLEKSYHGKAPKCILKYGTLTKVTEGDIMYYKLVEEKSVPDLFKIFGNMHFPIPLFEITKYGLIEEFNKLGFKDTITKTWFCHHPINDEPCGTCNPCKAVIKEGLEFRITPSGMKRYETEMKYGDHVWFRYYKKIRQKITKRL